MEVPDAGSFSTNSSKLSFPSDEELELLVEAGKLAMDDELLAKDGVDSDLFNSEFTKRVRTDSGRASHACITESGTVLELEFSEAET